METNLAPTVDLTTRDPAEGMRLAETISRRLVGQLNAATSTVPDPAAYLRTVVPAVTELGVLTAIQFGTIAAANNYWRKA